MLLFASLAALHWRSEDARLTALRWGGEWHNDVRNMLSHTPSTRLIATRRAPVRSHSLKMYDYIPNAWKTRHKHLLSRVRIAIGPLSPNSSSGERIPEELSLLQFEKLER